MVNVGRMEKKMETTIMGYTGILFGLYWGYIGIMENKMETTVVYISGYIWIMEKKMETAIVKYSLGFRPQFSKGVLEPYERGILSTGCHGKLPEYWQIGFDIETYPYQ